MLRQMDRMGRVYPALSIPTQPVRPPCERTKGRYDDDIAGRDGLRSIGRGRRRPSFSWMPTLAIDGGKSPAYIRNGMRALASALPGATYRTLPGQTHMISAKALVPLLTEFFADRS